MARTKRVGFVAALGLLAGLHGSACGGGGSTSSSSGSTGGAGGTYGAGDCRGCVTTACAPQIAACGADPECPGFLACLDGCAVGPEGDADAACVAACPTGTGTESKKAVAELNACREKGEGAACTACGVAAGITYDAPVLNQVCTTPSMETNPCYVCEDEQCCDTYAACLANPACGALKDCILACNDPGCEVACVAQHPAGADDWGARWGCLQVLCAIEQEMCDASMRDPCLDCLFGTCGDEYAGLLAAPDGFALQACVVACAIDDVACDAACYDAYPGPFPAFAELNACVKVACKGKC